KTKGFCIMHYTRYTRHGSPLIKLKSGGVGPVKKIKYEIDKNGCHICTSHAYNSFGYPRIMKNGKHYNMHRYLYMKHYGKIPKGLVVRHKCDVPGCINIEHLELGTYKDNSQDMIQRNRHHYGEINKSSKLTEEDVLEIRYIKN